jgi:hypothetical protein
MRLDVDVKKIDSELLLKRVRIKCNQIEVKTPIKATFSKLPEVSQINEIYKQIGFDALKDCIGGTKRGNTLKSRIKTAIKKQVNPSAINFFIINYPDERPPNEKQMQYLSNFQYVYSDVVITPVWSGFIRQGTSNAVDSFINLTNDYITQVQRLNNKTIVGMIPARTSFKCLKKSHR